MSLENTSQKKKPTRKPPPPPRRGNSQNKQNLSADYFDLKKENETTSDQKDKVFQQVKSFQQSHLKKVTNTNRKHQPTILNDQMKKSLMQQLQESLAYHDPYFPSNDDQTDSDWTDWD
ncbi:hypothetical protein M0812_04869 [Anaeramoeba flamelloides]|uniref:Uncharacterized protein n=1 Tax=Anaeramoeba flamelloides TaxID=1746091 RepID=A0AAV8AAC6_9EUKA|nr:hypothetical protein M0812_04869 [Anaeramoeba flamelloides]